MPAVYIDIPASVRLGSGQQARAQVAGTRRIRRMCCRSAVLRKPSRRHLPHMRTRRNRCAIVSFDRMPHWMESHRPCTVVVCRSASSVLWRYPHPRPSLPLVGCLLCPAHPQPVSFRGQTFLLPRSLPMAFSRRAGAALHVYLRFVAVGRGHFLRRTGFLWLLVCIGLVISVLSRKLKMPSQAFSPFCQPYFGAECPQDRRFPSVMTGAKTAFCPSIFTVSSVHCVRAVVRPFRCLYVLW